MGGLDWTGVEWDKLVQSCTGWVDCQELSAQLNKRAGLLMQYQVCFLFLFCLYLMILLTMAASSPPFQGHHHNTSVSTMYLVCGCLCAVSKPTCRHQVCQVPLLCASLPDDTEPSLTP